jgi:hypothetical protein
MSLGSSVRLAESLVAAVEVSLFVVRRAEKIVIAAIAIVATA